MSRYIDAEELKEQLQNFSKWCRDGRKHAVDFIVSRILPNMLVANVQEVKTAYWEWFEDCGFDGEVTECSDAGYRCSNCKAVPHESLYFDSPDDLPPFRYCPHCGCLMKEYAK